MGRGFLFVCAAALLAAACGRAPAGSLPTPVDDTPTPTPGASPEPSPTPPPFVDNDNDGLDDTWELDIAAAYSPFISRDPGDGCPLGGILIRVRPHPDNADLLHVVYDQLYERDCGFGGHIGDNEVFGATINPEIGAPFGLTALRAVCHQGTLCERTTECGTCDGLEPCDTVDDVPVVYVSSGKHASYVNLDSCGGFPCFDSCTLSETSAVFDFANAGEPGAPLTNDLTAAGLITPENGWTEASLMNFDPWAAGVEFGSAGSVADDLVDEAFLTPACEL